MDSKPTEQDSARQAESSTAHSPTVAPVSTLDAAGDTDANDLKAVNEEDSSDTDQYQPPKKGRRLWQSMLLVCPPSA